ncbi:hypothetical protein AB0C18_00510 [Nonomuraea muscovyensis]|uniref:hypothetical protein n=1 Tax=Nonomuraea muscovyensis TaxID=1124761 RepID=UPI0033FCDDA5
MALAIANASDKTTISRGSLTPRWEDGMVYGHTVIWLPALDHLVDVTVEQFPGTAAREEGPVVAGQCGRSSPAALAPMPRRTPAERVPLKRKHLCVTYTLAPLETTVALSDHPVPRAWMSDYRQARRQRRHDGRDHPG